MTLKIRPRWPKPNHFMMSKCYIHANLVKISQLVQEILSTQASFGSNLAVYVPQWSRKIGQDHQNLISSSTRPNVTSMQICVKTSSWDMVDKKTRNNMSPSLSVGDIIYQNIPKAQEIGSLSLFFRIWISANLDQSQMTFDNLWWYILSISMCMQNFITILHSVQEIGPFSLFQNLKLGKASADKKCHFAISWTRSCQYQCFKFLCKRLSKYTKRFRSYRHSPWTVWRQNLHKLPCRWQNLHKLSGDKMFNYRAYSESQPSVSVDFLRFVQYLVKCYSFPFTIIWNDILFSWVIYEVLLCIVCPAWTKLANLSMAPTLSAKIDEKEMHTLRISAMCFTKYSVSFQ